MTEFLLDTSIVLPFTRTGHPVAVRIEKDYGISSSAFRPPISVITLGEMRAFAKKWGDKRVELLENLLRSFPIVNIDRAEVIDAYADLHTINKEHGCAVGQNDLWIAACSRAISLPVLTSDGDLLRLPTGFVQVVKVNARSGETEIG